MFHIRALEEHFRFFLEWSVEKNTVFGPKRDEVTGVWRKLHNEELLICTPHTLLCG
jgi:hypothetical protein